MGGPPVHVDNARRDVQGLHPLQQPGSGTGSESVSRGGLWCLTTCAWYPCTGNAALPHTLSSSLLDPPKVSDCAPSYGPTVRLVSGADATGSVYFIGLCCERETLHGM